MFSDPSSGKMFCNSDIRYDKDQWLTIIHQQKNKTRIISKVKKAKSLGFLMTLYGKVEEVPYYALIVEMLLSSSTNQMW